VPGVHRPGAQPPLTARQLAYAHRVTDGPVRVRASVVRIIDHGDATTVIGPTVTRRFDGDSAALLRAVLDVHARPVDRAGLFGALAVRAGTPVDALAAGPIDELIALLASDGVLVPGPRGAAGVDREPARDAGVTGLGPELRRVVLGVSGAVAAVDAPALIRGLHAAGCEVRVALTRSAARLVSRIALEALTHRPVPIRVWRGDPGAPVPHIALAEWAELVVVCPASATTLSRLATGDCSDLVAAIVAATRAPVVVVPSMNDAMYGSPAIQANLATLRDHGRHVVHPALGGELAQPPHARPSVLGSAPPASAVVDVVRHLLAEPAARPRAPATADAWEVVWSTASADRLAWRAAGVEPALADALAAHHAPGRRLVDLGTGDGLVALAAARLGFEVTAIDIAPSALGRARAAADRAGARAIVFVLDDVTAPRLARSHDLAVDRGLLHSLPVARRAGYAAGVARLVAPGGTLLIAAHAPGVELGTEPITDDALAALLPGFAVVRATPTTLAGAEARLVELVRLAAPAASPI
jgi:SAM-dependent methyltransferase/3-polyprenyl-4-hydroxybenzoate decarboxylase